jgi:hypothetical protein
MIGDENSDDSVPMTTSSQKLMPIQIQAKPTAHLLFRTVNEKSKLTNRRSWVSLGHPPSMRPGRQAVWSDCLFTIAIPYHVPWGEGCHRKGRGGFSGLNVLTVNSTYLTIPYISHGNSK